MLVATTSGRAKELVKQGVAERNGMVAFAKNSITLWQDSWSGDTHRCFPQGPKTMKTYSKD